MNVHIFASHAISPVELPEQHCRVFGAGFESAYESGLLGGFSAPQDGWVNVMVLHGDALNPNSPYNAVTKEQIAASGLRYLAPGTSTRRAGCSARAIRPTPGPAARWGAALTSWAKRARTSSR